MQYSFKTVKCELEDRILVVTLSRPERLNAFTVTMADELVEVFTQANADDDVGAVIVTGAGRAFCAGMDLAVEGNVFGLDESVQPTLADMRERLHDPQIERGVRDTGGRVVLSIFACNKPVIAAINGDAAGVGATMTLPMDFRIAAEGARIGFVFAKIGIVPEACSSWFLPRLVGMQRALEWCYLGNMLSASECLSAGLLRSVVPQHEVLNEARGFARSLLVNRSAVAVAMTRQMLWRNASLPTPLDAHRIDSLVVFYLSQHDGREGIHAFLEKRRPQFQGRPSTDLPPIYPWWDDDRSNS
ncbi:MAG TPA: crotonase/enoyl-CoA hydratase family protein [Steroidobacteraceae bacterium]|jgi:enoyl-CoA hydratase/carnithine racemase